VLAHYRTNNWEGPHIDVASDNRAIDWWYTQVIGQTPAANGLPPSIEIVFKHGKRIYLFVYLQVQYSIFLGNTFQFGTLNTPLFPLEINGFDNDGQPFAHTYNFNNSLVSTNKNGSVSGVWNGDDGEITFLASADSKTFSVTLNTAYASGSMVIKSNVHYRTG
jgi:hypothetical protein